MVQVILWDRADDSFQPGQWFKGRIFEHSCDLSPSGNLMVCFAARNRLPDGNATLISHPPYLTALARWTHGDSWGGGGIFADETSLYLCPGLQFDPDEAKIRHRAERDSGLRIGLWQDWPGFVVGHGPDEAIRLRDGWRVFAPDPPSRPKGGLGPSGASQPAAGQPR
jgi:hypothetical protein